jgi:hypothetical protein
MHSAAVSRIEKREHGKALRKACPRSAHAEWKPRPKSLDPITWLEESDIDRVPGLVPLKLMAESAFQFFRGAAILQARDLAKARVSGVAVHACGDCHLLNFGGFASPERQLIFDINDFDETFPAPWEWDPKRLGASLVLAARDLRFSRSAAQSAVRAAVASYRERPSEYAQMTVLDTWYAQIRIDAITHGPAPPPLFALDCTGQADPRTSRPLHPAYRSPRHWERPVQNPSCSYVRPRRPPRSLSECRVGTGSSLYSVLEPGCSLSRAQPMSLT